MAYRQIAWVDPIEAASRLAGLPGLAWLDSAMAHPGLGRYSYLAAEPFGVLTVREGVALWNGVAEHAAPLAALRARLEAHRCERVAGLPPFQGGAIGFIGYEFGWTLEGRRPPQPARGDDAHLAFYDTVLAFDHVERRCFAFARNRPDALLDRLAGPSRPAGAFSEIVWAPTIDREAYQAAVARVRELIADGDVYQANIAQRFVAELAPGTEPFDIYRILRVQNPATFAAYLDCGARKILSTSPELFLRTCGREVETRPIKGTTRRLADAAADARAQAALLDSRKDRAENVMIVDLLRNDLAKVCVPESVEVPELCALESYAGLHHLVSAVTGTLADGADALDLVAATFPGGSITGAPKLRAMEIIAEIEGTPRGVYCGAIGAIGFNGDVVFNIAIRTLVVEDGKIELRTGGGITLLSDPQAEYEETIVKARRIFDAFAPNPEAVEAGA